MSEPLGNLDRFRTLLDQSDYDAIIALSRGGSAIVGPLGEYIAGPLFGEEGMLVSDLHHRLLAEAKFDFDVVGHYAQPDVFRLRVNDQP